MTYTHIHFSYLREVMFLYTFGCGCMFLYTFGCGWARVIGKKNRFSTEELAWFRFDLYTIPSRFILLLKSVFAKKHCNHSCSRCKLWDFASESTFHGACFPFKESKFIIKVAVIRWLSPLDAWIRLPEKGDRVGERQRHRQTLEHLSSPSMF